jgi:hypothetical protein
MASPASSLRASSSHSSSRSWSCQLSSSWRMRSGSRCWRRAWRICCCPHSSRPPAPAPRLMAPLQLRRRMRCSCRQWWCLGRAWTGLSAGATQVGGWVGAWVGGRSPRKRTGYLVLRQNPPPCRRICPPCLAPCPAGGLEDWAVRCRCGVSDDDGERMIMCDSW